MVSIGMIEELWTSADTTLEGGTPRPENINYLDLPDDFFRIRLVAQILDTCGVCFDRGAAKKKMDFFLTFFQVINYHALVLIFLHVSLVLHLHQDAAAHGY